MKYLPLVALSALLIGCATPSATLPSTPPPSATTPKIALVLGGGGAKGFAHVGVIEALESHNIKPDIIIGTSSGAMVGAIYASGKSASELKQIALHLKEDDLIDLAPSKQGLLEGQKLATFINQQVNHTPIEKLPITFKAVATDSQSKTAVSFEAGDTGHAVRASASVPKLFIAPRVPEIGGKKYIDGGQSALVPARFAKSLGADVVISVDVLSHHAPAKATPQTASIGRTDTGIVAKWGEQVIDIPINLSELKGKKLPFGIVLDEQIDHIFNQIPKHTTLDLPDEVAILSDPRQFWQKFELNAKMSQEDISASDVLIRPDLSTFSAFDGNERLAMMTVGKQATVAQIDAIKEQIKDKTPAPSAQ